MRPLVRGAVTLPPHDEGEAEESTGGRSRRRRDATLGGTVATRYGGLRDERPRSRRPVRVAIIAGHAPEATRTLVGHPASRLVAESVGRPVVEIAVGFG